MEFLNV